MGSLSELIEIYEKSSDFLEFYHKLIQILESLEKQTSIALEPYIKEEYNNLRQGLNEIIGISKGFYAPSSRLKKLSGTVYTKKPVCRFINHQAFRNYLFPKDLNSLSAIFNGRNVLVNFSVLDPACGAGFFLLDAFFLILKSIWDEIKGENIAEFKVIEEELTKIAFILMEKVIHGVDIDETAIKNARTVFKSIGMYMVLTSFIDYPYNTNKNETYIQLKDAIDANFPPTNFLLMNREVYREKFDTIIGNPPYIRVHKMDPELSKHLRINFIVPNKDFDIYICFFEQAVHFLKPRGVIAYITPDKYLLRQYAYKLRKFLLENVHIREIIDISRCNDIFDAAIYPVITVLVKNNLESNTNEIQPNGMYIKILNKFLENTWQTTSIIENVLKGNQMKDSNQDNIEFSLITGEILNQFKSNPQYEYNFVVDRVQQNLETLFSNYQNLGDMTDSITIFCGTPRAKDYHQLDQHIYDNAKPEQKNDLKYIVSHNIIPFSIIWGVEVNSIGHKYIHPHYQINGPQEEKSGFGRQVIERFKVIPKILVKANSKRLTAAMDLEGYAVNGIYGVILNQNIFKPIMIGDTIKGLNLLITLLNSDLINYYIINKFRSYMLNSSYLSVNSIILRSIPIPIVKQNHTSHQELKLGIISPMESINQKSIEITQIVKTILNESNTSNDKDRREELESIHIILSQILNGSNLESMNIQFIKKIKIPDIEKKIMAIIQLNQEINQEVYKLFKIPENIQNEINNCFYGVKS